MKCLPFLETSLIHHQMVIRGEICLGFDHAKDKFPNKYTSHSANVASWTKSDGVKINGFLFPNFM